MPAPGAVRPRCKPKRTWTGGTQCWRVTAKATDLSRCVTCGTYIASPHDVTRIEPRVPQSENPTESEPKPPYPRQSQPYPGRESEMRPRPDFGEQSYQGSGRLVGKKAL